MSAGILKMPMIRRMSVGASIGAQHSRDWVAIVSHPRPEKVFFPATPYEAKGIMRTALNGTDPCIIFESQRHLRQGRREFHGGSVPARRSTNGRPAVSKVPRRQGSHHPTLTIGATLTARSMRPRPISEVRRQADVINMPSRPLDYTDIITPSEDRTCCAGLRRLHRQRHLHQ